MFNKLHMLQRKSLATHLTEEEKRSLRESIMMHMDKNPMKQTVASPANHEHVSKTKYLHLITAAVLIVVSLLALVALAIAP